MVKHRNILLVYLFSIITFGIYAIYWLVSTKNDINSLGAKIPTAWLIIIPIANMAQSQNPVISDFYAKNLSKHGL